MKKRILALLLSTAMVISCTLPVYAANESIIVGSEGVPGPLSNDNAAAELETGDDPSQEVPQDSNNIIVSNIPESTEGKDIITPEPSSNEDSIAPPLQPGEENTNNPNTDTPQESESSDETSNEPTLESDKKIMEWGWYYEDDVSQPDKSSLELVYNNEKKEWVLILPILEGYTYDLEKILDILPKELDVTLDGEKNTQQIKITKWHSDTYIKTDSKNWPQDGTYYFTAELETGYSIDELIKINVVLENEKTGSMADTTKIIAPKTKKNNANHVSAKANTVTIGNWTYAISDGTAAIHSYNGTAASVTVPSTLTYGGITYKLNRIENSAFENNATLRSIVLPENITSLGMSVFKNCTNLSAVTINGNIGDCNLNSNGSISHCYASFYNAGTNASSFKVTFGSSVTRIPAYIFATGSSKSDDEYAHITSLVISDNVSEIGSDAFFNCYDLSTVSWGKGLKTLGSQCFTNNISLQSLTLPAKVTAIGASAFEGCTYLKTIVLPKSTSALGTSAFKNCTNLSSLTINGNIGDCNLNSNGSISHRYASFYNTGTNASSFKVTFGSSVTSIPAFIFATDSSKSNHKYAHITSVTIPASVKSIGRYSFYNCHDLSSVTVSSKTASVDESAFENCKSSLTFKCYYYSPIASYAKENKYKISYLDLPKVTVSSCVNYSSGIKITWKKSSSAAGYYIYRRTSSGSYSKVKTITKNSTLSWTDTSVKNKNGTAYYYLVKAYNSSKVSGSATSKKIVRMNGAAISSLSNKSGKKMYVKWKQNSKATGYQIQYSTSKTFSNGNKTTSVSGYKNISKTISGLSKGKTYYVRIRSYKTVSGTKYYSAWGSSKKVRINK